ncbi:hypothetical protein Dsin_028035 [Dipteronia sinensis]|uniref:Cytochrome P450 n=1 Tax=Dipteronia sinensis TaxID=43782 RepID=A0AAD9ZQD5_9ROSI|nr:hypothetical protein Dsin_028035 [Dipteronia sinensis]
MDFFSMISLLLLLLLLLLSLFFIFNLKSKNPNQPPSPPKLPIIGNLHQLGKLPHRSLQKLSQKYGPIMLLQLGKVPTLVISSPEIAKQVLKTHDIECCSRPLTQGPRRLSYNFLDIVFSPYTNYWKEMRKICVMELFNSKRVKSFASVREESVASLIDHISQTSPNPVNLGEKMFYLLDSIICKIACGRSYQGKQFQNGSKHDDVIQEAMAMLGSFSAADFFPHVGWIIDFLTGLHARREKCFHEFDEFYQMVIDEHLDPHRPVPENEDTVDSMLRLLKNQSDGRILTQDHIKAILMEIMVATMDNPSNAVEWAIAEMINQLEILEKAIEELERDVRKDRLVQESDFSQLNYIKACSREAFRLHPMPPFNVPHVSISDTTMANYFIPKDSHVLLNRLGLGRNPKVWPDEPLKFKLNRHLREDGSEVVLAKNDLRFISFSIGMRGCFGVTLGSSMTVMLFARLLQVLLRLHHQMRPKLTSLKLKIA